MMVLLHDVGQVKACLSLFGERKSRCKIGARSALNVPHAWKSSWAHPMALLGDVGLFGDSINLDTR
jgi:hypothetical protein